MEKIIIKGLKEEVYYEKLPSGLDVYLWKNEKCNSFFASLNVKYGSIDTEFKIKGMKKTCKVPNGIAHFLEHVKFNTKEGSAFDIFDELGSDINAFTTFEYTSYHVMGAGEVVKNINHLLDYVYTPYFKKNLIQQEKGIITEEAKAGFDDPASILMYKKFENALHNDKRKNRIVGSLEDIKNISLEDVELVYNTFYHPQNMFMVVTGNIDIYETLACIKENMAAKTFDEYKYPEVKRTKEPAKVVKKYDEFSANTEIPVVSFNVKIPFNKVGIETKNNILLSLILRCNFGASSEFKNDLIDNKLITGMSYARNAINDNILISIDARTKYPEEVIAKIEEKLKNLTVEKEDFERKKRAAIASLVFLYDDAEEVNLTIQDDIIYNKSHKVINNVKEIYETITYEDILEQLKKVDISNTSVILMKPQKKEP